MNNKYDIFDILASSNLSKDIWHIIAVLHRRGNLVRWLNYFRKQANRGRSVLVLTANRHFKGGWLIEAAVPLIEGRWYVRLGALHSHSFLKFVYDNKYNTLINIQNAPWETVQGSTKLCFPGCVDGTSCLIPLLRGQSASEAAWLVWT